MKLKRRSACIIRLGDGSIRSASRLEDIKDVVIEYLSRKSFLDRDSYMFLVRLAGIGLGEGEAPKEEELKRLKEMRKKEFARYVIE